MTYKDKESAKSDLAFIREIIGNLRNRDLDQVGIMLNDWKNKIEAEANRPERSYADLTRDRLGIRSAYDITT